MKRHVLVLLLVGLLAGTVQAAAIDLDNDSASLRGDRVADVSAAMRRDRMAALPASMSELPEPEVFAMMLVGLVLIGVRASRHSSEKFK